MKYLFAVITTLLLASHANADDSARVKQLEATIRELTIQNAKLIEQNRSLKLAKGADTEQLSEAWKALARINNSIQFVQEKLARLEALSGMQTAETSGLRPTYAGKVVAAVKPNIIFSGDTTGNPAAEVEVTSLPTGEILGRKLKRSSGVKAWDDAVLRAIDRTGRLPRDIDGRVPSPMLISFRPKD